MIKAKITGILQKSLLQLNPSLWIILLYIIIISIVSLFFSAADFNYSIRFFTLLWTFPMVLIIHTVYNGNLFLNYFKNSNIRKILSSYLYLSLLWLPYIITAIFYENLEYFITVIEPASTNVDYYLMLADDLLFGFQPTMVLQNYIHPFVVDYFMIAYSLYFVYPYLFLFYLVQKNQKLIFHRVLFAEIFALTISFSFFLSLPAQGPRYFFTEEVAAKYKDVPHYTTELKGISNPIIQNLTGHPSLFSYQYNLWNSIERLKTDCLPSMHTCLCLLCLIYAIKHRNLFKHKKLSMSFWIIGVASLIVSTVYLRYHWVLDVILGAIIVVPIYFITEKVCDFWEKRRNVSGSVDDNIPWL